MSKPGSNEEFIFDNRIVQRNIRDGRADRQEYEKYLASLPDLEDQSETLSQEIFSGSHSGLALVSEFIIHEQDE